MRQYVYILKKFPYIFIRSYPQKLYSHRFNFMLIPFIVNSFYLKQDKILNWGIVSQFKNESKIDVVFLLLRICLMQCYFY